MKPKGSTVCIAAMFFGWIAYVIAQGVFYAHFMTWLPMEITWGTAAVFLGECVSIARLKLAKERQPITDKKENPMLTKIGVNNLPDFEDEVQIAVSESGRHAKKEDT